MQRWIWVGMELPLHYCVNWHDIGDISFSEGLPVHTIRLRLNNGTGKEKIKIWHTHKD